MPRKNSHSDLQSSPQVLVLEAADFFHWAEKSDFQLFIKGVAPPRDGPIEKALLRLERRRKLRTIRLGLTQPKYYALPRKSKNFSPASYGELYHGLGCTKCGVRFYRANPDCELLPERVFRSGKWGSVPDGAFKYPNGSLLGFEFSTKHNISYPQIQIGKFQAYERSIPTINEAFNARMGVIFIWDIPRDSVQERIARWKPQGPYWFIDFASFLDIPIGDALTSPLYFRPDGRVEAIRK